MKRRIFFIFCLILCINLFLAFLLNKESILPLNDIMALLIGSYIVYGILNLYLYFQIKIKNYFGYAFTLMIGLFVSTVALLGLLCNLKNDKIIFSPIMYVVSLFATFLNWTVYEHQK